MTHRAAAFAFQAGARQAAFRHGAHDQRVAQFQDLRGDGVQEVGTLGVAGGAERVERGLRQTAGCVDLRGVHHVEGGRDVRARGRVPRFEGAAIALDGDAADQCITGDVETHNVLTFANAVGKMSRRLRKAGPKAGASISKVSPGATLTPSAKLRVAVPKKCTCTSPGRLNSGYLK